MRYFTMEKEVMRGLPVAYEVNAEGRAIGSECNVLEVHEICIGFTVSELGKDGRTEKTVFYPVSTDTRTFLDNSEEVLEKIAMDYSVNNGWRNNE